MTERQETALLVKKFMDTKGADLQSLEDMHGLMYQAEEAGEVDDTFEHRDFWMNLSDYCKDEAMQLNIDTLETVYGQMYEKFLLFETKYLFVSFILYMEKNRPYDKRFYEPRRKTLSVVVKDLQDLEDGKYKFYGLSMPPRVGKALEYNTPILTRNGWKKHGELVVGDEVIGIDGRFKKVLAVHPPCEMQYKVTFADGEEIICHGNHEWVVQFRGTRGYGLISTESLRKYLFLKNTCVPKHKYSDSEAVYFSEITPISGFTGNCITVEDGIYLAGKTLKPTHNSTICIFFLAWVACKHPNSHNAMGGHSGILAKGFYKELMNLFSTAEYSFAEIYERMHPGRPVIRDKSAEEYTITLDKPDRFATITCRGIDGTWTGAIDISNDGYLYVDDLIRDREHSLSPARMENTFQEMLNKMFDRRNNVSKVLMVGTLWSVLDPLERMRVAYQNNPKYKFRRIPALDFITDESNFDYEFNGFSTEYYRETRQQLEQAEWFAKFQQKPFVREGLLFPSDELRYFNGILPEGDSRIVAVVDVAFGGGDSLSMPIGREYENGDVYIFDWVFSTGAKEQTIPIVVGRIISNEIRNIRFEANTGGDMYCQYVDDELKRQNYKCSCTAKRAPNTMDKLAKINAYAGDIKRNFVFLGQHKHSETEKEEEKRLGIVRYERSSEYNRAMEEVNMFVTIGKNPHDDAVDSLTQLSMFCENPYSTVTKITRGGRF